MTINLSARKRGLQLVCSVCVCKYTSTDGWYFMRYTIKQFPCTWKHQLYHVTMAIKYNMHCQPITRRCRTWICETSLNKVSSTSSAIVLWRWKCDIEYRGIGTRAERLRELSAFADYFGTCTSNSSWFMVSENQQHGQPLWQPVKINPLKVWLWYKHKSEQDKFLVFQFAGQYLLPVHYDTLHKPTMCVRGVTFSDKLIWEWV